MKMLSEEIESLGQSRDDQTKDRKEFFEKREELADRISQLDKELYRLSSQKEQLE